MKILNYLLTLTLSIGVMLGLNAQKEMTKGYFRLEITDISSENEQIMAMAGMLKGSYTDIYFSPEKSLTKANMMGGMTETTVLVDFKSNENIMLMSMMGQKMKIDMDQEEYEKYTTGQVDKDAITYEHFRDETKEILGFKCHKVKMIVAEAQEANMTLWITEDIKSEAFVTNGVQTELLGGFPLEYIISVAGQMDMTMQATKFEKDFDNDVFNVSTEGYKEMTMDEFLQSVGGMGGF